MVRHVLRKDKNGYVKNAWIMKLLRPRGRPKTVWSDVTEKDCQT